MANGTDKTGGQLIQIEIGDLLGLEHIGPWGNRILDSVSGGIGWSVKNLLAKQIARNQAAAHLIATKASTEAEAHRKLTLARVDHIVAAEQEALTTSAGRATIRVAAEEIKQQENLEAIVVKAIGYANEQETAGKKFDQQTAHLNDSWFDEFKDFSKNTSEPRMRDLWARVLAGEAQNPGTYSIRSLWALKTISPTDAESFRRAAQLLVNGLGIIRTNDSFNTGDGFFGTRYGELLSLVNAGLVATNFENTIQRIAFKPQEKKILRIADQKYMFSNSSAEPITVKLPVAVFSDVGIELAQLIDRVPPKDYILGILKFFADNGIEVPAIET